MENMIIKTIVQKIDVDSPGLFIFKLNTSIGEHEYDLISKQINKEINIVCPGSHSILLDDCFDVVDEADDEIMEKLGWVRKIG